MEPRQRGGHHSYIWELDIYSSLTAPIDVVNRSGNGTGSDILVVEILTEITSCCFSCPCLKLLSDLVLLIALASLTATCWDMLFGRIGPRALWCHAAVEVPYLTAVLQSARRELNITLTDGLSIAVT
jgi:hypothetical protein